MSSKNIESLFSVKGNGASFLNSLIAAEIITPLTHEGPLARKNIICVKRLEKTHEDLKTS